MKVTIDTKEDSHEDIKKVLHILSNMIQNKNEDSVNQSSSVDTTNMMNMFSNNNPETKEEPAVVPMSMFTNSEPQKKVPDTPPDFTSLLNLAKKDDENNDQEPKVQLF